MIGAFAAEPNGGLLLTGTLSSATLKQSNGWHCNTDCP